MPSTALPDAPRRQGPRTAARPRAKHRRSAFLVGLAAALAAAGALAGPMRPDAPEGPRSLPRTLGSYGIEAPQPLDMPTLAGAAPGDAEAAAEDKVRRLSEGLMAEAGDGAAEAAPDAIAGAAEIVLAAPPRADGGPDYLATIIVLQHGPARAAAVVRPDGARPPATALGTGLRPAGADGPSPILGPTIDPSGYAAAATAGPEALVAALAHLPSTIAALDAGAHEPGRPAARHLAAAGHEPRRLLAAPAGWLPGGAGPTVKRMNSFPAYLAAGSMTGATVVLLTILRLQSRRRRRRRR